MKKYGVNLSTLIFVLLGSIISINVARAMDDSEEQLKSFVNKTNEYYKTGTIRSMESWSKNYHPQISQSYLSHQEAALSDQNLRKVSLDIKYRCANDIQETYNQTNTFNNLFTKDSGPISCFPALIIEKILLSLHKTESADPASILAKMKTVNESNLEMKERPNEEWASYCIKQARNKELNKDLRTAFAEYYPKISTSTDREEFKDILLHEIGG